jgi:hypothetical protein
MSLPVILIKAPRFYGFCSRLDTVVVKACALRFLVVDGKSRPRLGLSVPSRQAATPSSTSFPAHCMQHLQISDVLGASSGHSSRPFVMPNFAYADVEEAHFACLHCGERRFKDLHSLYDHCRNASTHNGEWCERCKRLFQSPSALEQHRSKSSLHNICRLCHLDCTSVSQHQRHEWDDHAYCARCELRFECEDDLIEHLEKHHLTCYHCDTDFSNYHNLIQVSMHSYTQRVNDLTS